MGSSVGVWDPETVPNIAGFAAAPPRTPMAPQPLSDEEVERLSDLLERFGAESAMNIEQLDGFLAALISGPEEVPQSEYLR